MTPIRTMLFAAFAALAMSACATPAEESTEFESRSGEVRTVPAKPPARETGTPPASGEEEAMTCDATNMAWANGKLADEALVTKIRLDTGSKAVRVIKPGMMVTMDYREDRVNIDVDAENRVTNVRCG